MRQYQVTFIQAVQRAFNKYCVFSGRASRSEYWWFILFVTIIGWVLAAPSFAASVQTIADGVNANMAAAEFSVWDGVYSLWTLIILLPTMGLMFRRLHDSGHSGWNWFWSFLPVIGTIILLVYLCQPSVPAPNKYGPVPNEIKDQF